jgi:predicted N-formylglutamate amidohydrolase
MTPADRRVGELVLTCEHAGNRIPKEYAQLFRGAKTALESHRGWDDGALELARVMERRLGRPLHFTTWSRLLVESNRSPSNRRIWSSFTATLPKSDRARILERWWRPHREKVEAAVAEALTKGRVVHVAVHSFTPELDGVARNADVTVLYDSRRKREAEFCHRWMAALRGLDPRLRIRRNYPYLGKADGLTTALRKRYPESRYLGIELEINQGLVGTKGWSALKTNLAESLGQALGQAVG